MKTKNLNYLFISILLVMFNSCAKDDINIRENSETSKNIISFENFSEYKIAQEKVLTMNNEELKNYEESLGYKSFGRASEEFYRNIEMDKFNSKEEIVSFVIKNNHFLQLIDDENGELELETKFYNNPKRYFLNKDYMFEIGNSLYKVVEEGVIISGSENYDLLKEIDSDNIESYVNKNEGLTFLSNKFKVEDNGLKDATYNCGQSKTARKTNGRDRVKMEMSISYSDTYGWDPINQVEYPMTILNNYVLIRPYKRTLGIWYWCSRTLSCDLKIAVDTYYSNIGWGRKNFHKSEPGKHDSKLEYTLEGGVISEGYFSRYNMHYSGLDCWAKSGSTGRATIECNPGIAQ